MADTTITATASNLREVLVMVFTTDELVVVCRDCSVDPDDVPNRDAGKVVWAGELIAYCERRDRLDAFVAACAKQRDNVDWAALLKAHRSVQPPQIDAIGERVTGFIGVLAGLMQNPQAREIVLLFRHDFSDANEHITALNNYKQLHDLFQELELNYTPIDTDLKRVIGDPSAWDTLSQHLADAQGVIGDLEAMAAKAGLPPDESQWVRQLAQVRQDLQRALDALDAAPLDGARRTIRRTLDREPSRINTRMIEVVKVLLNSGLIRRMEALRESLVSQKIAGFNLEDYMAGLVGLAELRDKLRDLAADHNQWQAVDDELSRIENNLASDASELERGWPYVTNIARPMLDGNNTDWAASLTKIESNLQDALQARAAPRARALFNQFRSQASRRFRRVDDDLLAVCNELKKIGIDLSALLSQM